MTKQDDEKTVNADGLYHDEYTQQQLADKRSQREIAEARATINRLWIALFFVLAIALVEGVGWKSAVAKLYHDVRVAWVKMLPNGTSQVEFWDDGGSSNRLYQAPINKSLLDYIDCNWQRHHSTIDSDFGFVMFYKGDELRKAFIDPKGFNAAKYAADFAANSLAPEVDVKVRALDHDTKIRPTKASHFTGTVETTAYVTLHTHGAGVLPSDENKIIKLVWRLRTDEDMDDLLDTQNLDALKANPDGIVIESEKMLDDIVSPGEK